MSRVDRIRHIAVAMRRRAEAFARMKGYDAETLITMCSTVSAGLEVALRGVGYVATIVFGTFDGEGHFWVRVRHDGASLILDLTATQFEERRLPPVLIAKENDPVGTLYVEMARGRCSWAHIRDCDFADVAEFKWRTLSWLRRRSRGQRVSVLPVDAGCVA